MTFLEKAQAMQELMATAGSIEAFEKYYGEGCIITEMPSGEKRIGKDAQRTAIQEWFSSVEEYHGGGVEAITSNEDTATTMVECWFDVTFRQGGRVKMKEVAIQQWQDDHIIAERFYYHMPGQ